MIPNQILSQSLLREVNYPESYGGVNVNSNYNNNDIIDQTLNNRPRTTGNRAAPAASFRERDLIGRLNEEDQIFDNMRLKNVPTNTQKMNEIMDLKRRRDIKPTEDDLDYQKLMKQLEYATAKNAQYKQDMAMIDTALDALDPRKKMLIGTDVDKKFALESLRSKRMQIRDKERVFTDQLQQFHDYYAFNERNRVEKGIINEDFLAQKRPKILELKLMHEQIDGDKATFLDHFDKIRSGYSIKAQPFFTAVGAGTLGLPGLPSYLAVDNDLGRARDKLQDDARKLDRMKQDQIYYYTRNHLPIDPEEVFGSNKTNFRNEIKYLMETNKYAQSNEDKYTKLKLIRENLEKLGAEKGLNMSKVKLQFIEETPDSIQQYQTTLRDIESLRKDYIQSGGVDPEFLLNLQNLEQFYKENRFNPINRDLIRMHQGQPLSDQDPPGFYYNSTVNPRQPPGQQSQQQFQQGGGGQMNPYQQVDLSQYAGVPDEGNVSSHPIYEYLPESFKKQVENLEMRNKSMRYDLGSIHVPPVADIPSSMVDASALLPIPGGDTSLSTRTEDQMLNYVRGQEAELLLSMSRMNPSTVQYGAKHAQFMQVQQMKAGLEKSLLDKKVQAAIKGANGSLNNSTMLGGNTTVGNVSIVQGAAGQSLNGSMMSLQRAPVMYTPNEGFILRWDWIGSLPINYQRMKIAFGVFRKGDNFFTYRDSNLFPAEQETYRSNKCLFLQKEVIRDVQPFPDTVIYIEFWGYQHTSDGVPSKPEVIGWSMHELFDYNGTLNPGKYRLPFYSKVFQPNELFSDGLPYMSNSAMFLRVCLPMDPYFDVDSTVLLQNEYKVQELHLRKKRILRIDDANDNPYASDVPNSRFLLVADKNVSGVYDPNQSSIQNQDQSTMIPNLSTSLKPQVVRDDTHKPTDFSSFGPQSMMKSQFGIMLPTEQDSISVSQAVPRGQSSTSIELLSNKDIQRSLKIRLIKLSGVKMDVKTLQIRSVIFQKNEIVLTRTKNPSADNVKLEDVQVKGGEIQMNVRMNQDIDWKEIMQKHTRRDLEKVVFYCAIFKHVVGKEDELLGWLVWPIYKVDSDQKSINSGLFTTSIFKKPAQKPPFGEKKEKSEIQLQFEIEAVGNDTPAPSEKKKTMIIAGSQKMIPEEDDDIRLASSKQIQPKRLEEPLDNSRKLTVDLFGLSKYILTKNDLQYKMEILKEGLPIQDENGHKCIEQKPINIIEKGKEVWRIDQEQRFEIGQVSLSSQFKESNYAKGFLVITIMIKDKTEVVGVAKVPLFVPGTNQLNEGRNKMELVKIEKNGTEKPVRYILDYALLYANHNQLVTKSYDPNKGIRILMKELTNYREKFDVTYSISVRKGKAIMENNMGKPAVVNGEDFVACVVKEKKIPFGDTHFMPVNLERVKETMRRQLDDIYVLFEFVIDKSEGKGTQDIEENYAWFSHQLFKDGAIVSGRFNEQIFKLPIENAVMPIDPKKMKKFLIKFEYEINEEVGKGGDIRSAAPSKSFVSMNPTLQTQQDDDNSNKFNVFIDKITRIKFKTAATAKLAVVFNDEIFPTDKGELCSFTGEMTKPVGDLLDLNEEYDMEINVENLKKKYAKQLDNFYVFVNILDQTSKPVLWFLTKLFDKGQLRVGKFTENAFEPPVQAKFSQSLRTAKKSTSMISFEIKKGFSDGSSVG